MGLRARLDASSRAVCHCCRKGARERGSRLGESVKLVEQLLRAEQPSNREEESR